MVSLLFSVGCLLLLVRLWISYEIDHNPDATKPLYTLEMIANDYWKTYGRHYYTRYDYEGITTEKADDLMKHLYQQIEEFKQPSK